VAIVGRRRCGGSSDAGLGGDVMDKNTVETNVGTFERQVCEVEGCDELGEPCWIESRDKPDTWVCAEHMHQQGFCIGCGQFYAGIESFDFGPDWCDNCAPEFEEEEYDGDMYGDMLY